MSKTGGFLTPKAIANRIKAKGLQKLKWYCQLCQKQCRDENGFKCHCNSESHKRQMMVFGQNPHKVVETYSQEFERNFLEHLRMSHPHSRVQATVVWNEFIANRHHIHMNSTKWTTLTEFVKYLGREGKCKVEETEKGWFITLVSKDPAQELEEERRSKRERHEREEETRAAKALQEQIERAQKHAKTDPEEPASTELERDDGAGPLTLEVDFSKRKPAPSRQVQASSLPTFAGDDVAGGSKDQKHEKKGLPPRPQKERRNALEELMKKDQAQKASKRSEFWLAKGIIVKVMARELKDEGYYKKKGSVERVVDSRVAEISMLDSGDVLRVDQEQLETVIPQPGGQVLIVNGAYRGSRAKLLDVDLNKFKGHLRVTSGNMKGESLWLDYEDFSKAATE
uniref:DNA/RNA-binding protein KIN17 n=1 Tax=Tetraselmis sp. GSL018 TaxID=582737 RepID=A0A061SGC7_9CHLO